MRIGIISPSFPSDKDDYAGILAREVASGLMRLGHEVIVLAPHNSDEEQIKVLKMWRLGDEKSLVTLKIGNPIDFIKAFSFVFVNSIWVPYVAKREKIDFFICLWGIPSGIFGLLSRIVSKVEYGVWWLGSDIWKIDRYPMGVSISRQIAKVAKFRFADGIALAEEASKLLGQSVTFLPTSRGRKEKALSVKENFFRPTSADGFHRLIAIGRYHPNKGMDLLVKACIQLNSFGVNCVLEIYGEGEDEQLLKSLVSQSPFKDRIYVKGPIPADSIADLVQKVDLAVIPSRIESIPMVLSEYCRVGVNLVATAVGDLGIILSEYDAGLICEPSVEGLVTAIRQALGSNTTGTKVGQNLLSEYLDLNRSLETIIKEISFNEKI
jgi:glycosyltransferase involved in cell wall biosynthesis